VERLEALARAALRCDSLLLRSLSQDFLRETPQLENCRRPGTDDAEVLAVAASLIELLAERSRQSPPSWTQEIGPVSEPIYLVPSAASMKRLRMLCEQESPEPLRKRGFYAPPNFLEYA
jgi:hypothetical protein